MDHNSNVDTLQDCNRVARELPVGGDDGQLMVQCLTDQHPVERVAVMRWEHQEARNRLDFQRQIRNSMRGALAVDVFVSRFRASFPF